MENIKTEVKGSILTITVDLSVSGSVSNSGKSRVLATSRGNAKIEGTDLMLGLNVYRKV